MGADREIFNEVLRSEGDCFGRHFAKTAPECRDCMAPVLWEGELYFLREVCRSVCRGEEGPGGRLNRLTSQDVLERIQEGAGPVEIFDEILGEADPDEVATEARQVLYNRFYYLDREYGLPMPDLPRTSELLKRRDDVSREDDQS